MTTHKSEYVYKRLATRTYTRTEFEIRNSDHEPLIKNAGTSYSSSFYYAQKKLLSQCESIGIVEGGNRWEYKLPKTKRLPRLTKLD